MLHGRQAGLSADAVRKRARQAFKRRREIARLIHAAHQAPGLLGRLALEAQCRRIERASPHGFDKKGARKWPGLHSWLRAAGAAMPSSAQARPVAIKPWRAVGITPALSTDVFQMRLRGMLSMCAATAKALIPKISNTVLSSPTLAVPSGAIAPAREICVKISLSSLFGRTPMLAMNGYSECRRHARVREAHSRSEKTCLPPALTCVGRVIYLVIGDYKHGSREGDGNGSGSRTAPGAGSRSGD